MAKILEMHVIQSYPINSMNRDGNGKPKNMFFGGFERNRISSQCYKRAMRRYGTENYPEIYGSIRTRNWKELKNHVEKLYSIELDEDIVKIIKSVFLSSKGEKKEKEIMIFISGEEFYKAYLSLKDNPEDKAALDVLKSSFVSARDNAEILMFGRMIANNPSLNIDGCLSVGHVMSTHKAKMEFDFFSALDELSQDEGSGHLDASMFNSFVGYRYFSINLDMMEKYCDSKFDKAAYNKIIRSAVESGIYAFPNGKRTSFTSISLPSYIDVMVRKGQPLTYDNAFFNPIGGSDILAKSILEYQNQKEKTLNLYPVIKDGMIFNSNLPDLNAKELVDEIEKHI